MINDHDRGYEHRSLWSLIILIHAWMYCSCYDRLLIIAMICWSTYEQGCWSCMITYIIMSSWTLSWTLLPNDRILGSAVTLPGHGVYLLGGGAHAMRVTSDFLEAGSDVWGAGPALPESMAFPCTVALSTSFLTVNGRSVREYDIRTGWKSQDTWPYLQTGGDIGYHPGCALVGHQGVITCLAWHRLGDTKSVNK